MIQLNLFSHFEEVSDVEGMQCQQEEEEKGSVFGLGYCSGAIRSGKYGIPKIKAYHDVIPENFVTYSEFSTSTDYSCGIVSFDDDKVIERVWKNPDRYISTFSKFQCVGEPDLSLKLKYPLALQIGNTFKNHALAFRMQDRGLKILPSMSWSSTESYEFCFDGHERGGAVIVSTIGTLSDERSSMYFKLGFQEMLKRISPDAVVLYGDINDRLMELMPKQLHIVNVEHNRFKRARNHGSKRCI